MHEWFWARGRFLSCTKIVIDDRNRIFSQTHTYSRTLVFSFAQPQIRWNRNVKKKFTNCIRCDTMLLPILFVVRATACLKWCIFYRCCLFHTFRRHFYLFIYLLSILFSFSLLLFSFSLRLI